MCDTHAVYDWYVWIDDDIYLTDLDTRLEELLAPYTFDDVLVSKDPSRWNPFNSGFLVMKNTSRVQRMLAKVWKIGSHVHLS
jgi:hypothetical protein